MLLTSLILALMFWQWRPIPAVIWEAEHPLPVALLTGVFFFGWGVALYSSWIIDHFDLFGLRQVYLHLRNRPYSHPPFAVKSLYRFVRHPLMVGLFIGIWSTPTMTAGHLLFALLMSAYILVGVTLEERDLARQLGTDFTFTVADTDVRARSPQTKDSCEPGTERLASLGLLAFPPSMGADVVEPRVVLLAQIIGDVRVLGGQIIGFARVGDQVVQLEPRDAVENRAIAPALGGRDPRIPSQPEEVFVRAAGLDQFPSFSDRGEIQLARRRAIAVALDDQRPLGPRRRRVAQQREQASTVEFHAGRGVDAAGIQDRRQTSMCAARRVTFVPPWKPAGQRIATERGCRLRTLCLSYRAARRRSISAAWYMAPPLSDVKIKQRVLFQPQFLRAVPIGRSCRRRSRSSRR